MLSSKPAQRQPVGVSGFPIIGSMPEFARDPIKFITRLQNEYGDVAAFSLMGKQSVLISNPQDIERVLLETGKHYGKFHPTYAMRTILGNGLVTSEGDFWKRQRKLAAPAFHHQSIKRYADQMVTYAQDMAQTWQSGAVRDIHQDMMTLTQRIIMKVLFDVDVLDNAAEASKAFDDMMQALGADMGGIEAILPGFVPTPVRTRMVEGVKYIDGLLLEIIEKRRAEGSEKHDLLTMLMEARDDEGQPMRTEQLLDEIRTLYLAGHETTATTLSWTWFLLSRNPEVYARLESEIEQVLDGRAPTAEDVQQLPYCNAVIKESLRCYPVAWITQRIALEDVEIGGYQVAKDTMIFLSPWIVHHDARWYTEPDAFIPERWLKDKAEQPARETYIPFGGGPHICLGNGLAMMEGVLLLATLLQHDHVSILPEYPVEIGLAGTLRPKSGLQATFIGRDR
ncbi:MAG: cytochrome P450 [Anaerolineae bacterium]|nr:cytochrome P450 [Anaerolineae bacterium]